eukprot:3940267-Rhodomonas_salina.3
METYPMFSNKVRNQCDHLRACALGMHAALVARSVSFCNAAVTVCLSRLELTMYPNYERAKRCN